MQSDKNFIIFSLTDLLVEELETTLNIVRI
jgi:hypothetical protein